jgi:hypothetical protein
MRLNKFKFPAPLFLSPWFSDDDFGEGGPVGKFFSAGFGRTGAVLALRGGGKSAATSGESSRSFRIRSLAGIISLEALGNYNSTDE